MTDNYSHEIADYMFGEINEVDDEFRAIIAKSIAKLPKEVVDW